MARDGVFDAKRFWYALEWNKTEPMNIAIEIPDEVARQLAARSGEVSRAVLEAVAVEAFRSGTITPRQVQQMLGLTSRWETEDLLRRAEAYHDYTMDDLQRDIVNIRDASRR